MNAKLCVWVLLAGCTGDVGDDMSMDPGTADDAAMVPRDASNDARGSDGGARDARTSVDAQDSGAVEQEDATAPAQDAAVDSATPLVDAAMPMTGSKPLFVAVGYRSTRLVSRDLGLNWTETGKIEGEGDDDFLLRGAAYANGRFVAAGWHIFSSTDGTTWTPHTNPTSEWVGGLDYGNGVFVGAGGSGTSIYSSDGINWSAGKPRDGVHTRSLVFGSGKFVGATDNKDWWSTTDGNNWTKEAGGHETNQVVWCAGSFSDRKNCGEPLAHGKSTAFGMGVYVSIDAGGNKIQRSTDGKAWTDVKTVTEQAWLEDVVFGLVP